MGKNSLKNKAVRRVVDDLLINPGSLSSIPGMSMASSVYRSAKIAKRGAKAPARSGVSPCLKQWYTCLTDPFNSAATGACIPTGGNHASARNFGYLRFDATVGTNGLGLVAFMPSPTNNCPTVILSGATFAGTFGVPGPLATSNVALSVGLSTLVTNNNRYTFSQMTTPNLLNPLSSGRLVGGGFRVAYTGKAVNLGGLLYIYTSPTHAEVDVDPVDSAPMGPGDMSGYQECIIKPITREPQEFILTPQRETELEYPDGSTNWKHVYPWSVSQTINTFLVTLPGSQQMASPTTMIYFTGEPGNTLHFEYGMHVEAIGALTEGQRFPADSDPVGVETMMAAISNATINIASSKGNFKESLKNAYLKAAAKREVKVKL